MYGIRCDHGSWDRGRCILREYYNGLPDYAVKFLKHGRSCPIVYSKGDGEHFMTIQKYNCNFEKLDLKVIERWKEVPPAVVSDCMNRSNKIA